VFEGVVPETLEQVIRSLVSEGAFSLSDLNVATEQFEYAGSDITNKPGALSEALSTFKVKFTQAQMWCFLRLFPLFVGNFVEEGNPHWAVLLELLDVVEMICAREFSNGDIEYMGERIEGFHYLFRETYPDVNVKAKRHYTVHYAALTRVFGPLIHCVTTRFEGKHEYFMGLFSKTKNKKNICQTFARKHQLKQALLHEQNDFLGISQDVATGVKVAYLQLLDKSVQEILRPFIRIVKF
jgi:hypothetical protein